MNNLENCGFSQLHLCPWEDHGVSYVGAYFWACEEEKNLRQHEFAKGKLYLINSTAFFDKMTRFLYEGRKGDVIYTKFS